MSGRVLRFSYRKDESHCDNEGGRETELVTFMERNKVQMLCKDGSGNIQYIVTSAPIKNRLKVLLNVTLHGISGNKVIARTRCDRTLKQKNKLLTR